MSWQDTILAELREHREESQREHATRAAEHAELKAILGEMQKRDDRLEARIGKVEKVAWTANGLLTALAGWLGFSGKTG